MILNFDATINSCTQRYIKGCLTLTFLFVRARVVVMFNLNMSGITADINH